DGSASFDFSGTYTSVKPNTEIAYTLDDGRTVTVTFTPKNNQTKIVEAFEAETMHSLEMQRGGWQAILDNFKKYVEAN
ncbi:MAG: SRPBCC domain-containing protein, partial [Nitrososphaera sp.]